MKSLAEMWQDQSGQKVDLVRHAVEHAARELQVTDGVEVSSELEGCGWEACLRALFPRHVSTFAPHHAEFWEHIWPIRLTDAPDPFVAIWGRGAGKSTSAELAAVALGIRGRRRYGWYVRETQERADDSLANIAQLLEDGEVEKHYPAHAVRKVSKYGHSRGWNSTRLRTAGGFTIDAIGLDTATRGLKVEDLRPDLMILDDLDGKHDSARATAKKIATLTTSVLPAGTDQTAILAIQNLVIPHGIFARLKDGRADFLATRRVSGPVPVVRGLKTEVRDDPDLGRRRAYVTAGEPTWEGQDLEACQRLMDRIGLRSFLQESQHEVSVREGALWKPEDIDHVDAAPRLKRVVVGVDPSGGGDEIGIIACTCFPSEPMILVYLLWIEARPADLDLHQSNPTCLAAYHSNNPIGAQLFWRISAATVQLIRHLGETRKSALWPTGNANNRPAELGNGTDHREERRGRPKFGFSVTPDVDRRKESDLMPAHRHVLLGRHGCSSS